MTANEHEWDPSYEWLVQRLRSSLATAADSAGELSALNKDLKAMTDRNYELIREVDILRVTYNKDITAIKTETKDIKADLQKFKDKFTFYKIVPIVLTTSLLIIGSAKLLIEMFKYIQHLR